MVDIRTCPVRTFVSRRFTGDHPELPQSSTCPKIYFKYAKIPVISVMYQSLHSGRAATESAQLHLHVPRLIGGSAATCADLPQAQPGTAVPKVTYMGGGSPCHFGFLKCNIHPAADLLIWPTHLPSTNAPSTFFRCFCLRGYQVTCFT